MSKEHYNGAGFRGAIPPVLRHNARLNIIHFTFLFVATYWTIVFLIGKIHSKTKILVYICIDAREIAILSLNYNVLVAILFYAYLPNI